MDFLPIAHDWKETFVMTYGFTTSVLSAQSLLEQRINGQDTPVRTVKLSNWECPAKLKNRLRYLLNKIVDVAIFSEPLTVNTSGSLYGLDVLPILEDTSTFFNLRFYATRVVVFDMVNNVGEIKGLTTRNDHSLILSSALLRDMQAKDVVVYPTLAGVISDLDIKDITDNVSQVSLSVKEI